LVDSKLFLPSDSFSSFGHDVDPLTHPTSCRIIHRHFAERASKDVADVGDDDDQEKSKEPRAENVANEMNLSEMIASSLLMTSKDVSLMGIILSFPALYEKTLHGTEVVQNATNNFLVNKDDHSIHLSGIDSNELDYTFVNSASMRIQSCLWAWYCRRQY
jgi:hypothetical protein